MSVFAERHFTGIRRGPFAPFRRFQLIAPRIQQPPVDPELLRQFHDVVALLQTVRPVLPKRLRKLAHTASWSRLPPSWCKCANVGCLNLGVSPLFQPSIEAKGIMMRRFISLAFNSRPCLQDFGNKLSTFASSFCGSNIQLWTFSSRIRAIKYDLA